MQGIIRCSSPGFSGVIYLHNGVGILFLALSDRSLALVNRQDWVEQSRGHSSPSTLTVRSTLLCLLYQTNSEWCLTDITNLHHRSDQIAQIVCYSFCCRKCFHSKAATAIKCTRGEKWSVIFQIYHSPTISTPWKHYYKFFISKYILVNISLIVSNFLAAKLIIFFLAQ